MLADRYAGAKDDSFALYRLAAIALDAGLELPEALGWIERSNDLSKGEKFYVWDTRAGLLWKPGRPTEAIAALEKAIGLCPRDDAKAEMTGRLGTWRKSAGCG